MPGWALVFPLFALVAGYLRFFGLTGAAAWNAQILLVVFAALLIIGAFWGAMRGRPRV